MIKPILFNTEMVKATLNDQKTETRRLIRPQFPTYQDREPGHFSKIEHYGRASFLATHKEKPAMKTILNPPVLPGDILYVRETWAKPFLPDSDELHYRADYSTDDIVLREGPYPDSKRVTDVTWRPSIHMPKDAARIFLRVTDVRVERLQEITEVGARNEGAEMIQNARELWSYRKGFETIWNSTLKHMDHVRYGWTANPWVWVISFERYEMPAGWPDIE